MMVLIGSAMSLFPGALRAQSSLAIDFNDRSNDLPGNTHEDFDSFVIGSTSGSTAVQFNTNSLLYGSVTISISDLLGLGRDDRKRSTPTNNGAFTEAQLLQDFVFALGPNVTNGLNIRIEGLAPNQDCQVTIWFFDSG